MSKAQMKLAGLMLACLLIFGLAGSAMAQSSMHPVEGKYDVSATGDAIGTITFQMVIKREGDKWAAQIMNSPQPLTVSKVTVGDDNKLSLTADSGGTEVVLTASYDNGKITGKWTAGDATGTWTATKQVAAAAPSSASGAPTAAGSLEGTYAAEIIADGQGTLNFTLVVKKEGDKLVTEVKDGGDINIVGIDVKEDAVTLNATFQGNPFTLPGKRNGTGMGGKWEAGGFSGTWSAKKK
ncbi:MAG TPA: hypothetical protein VFD58_21610 [Blastocatellia bacterium]|nr:hypothetical protein [Blastocatellia bacterium]